MIRIEDGDTLYMAWLHDVWVYPPLKFKNKRAAAFGSYGWGGGSVKQISAKLAEAGFELVNDGIGKLWVPDDIALDDCKEYGREFAKAIAS